MLSHLLAAAHQNSQDHQPGAQSPTSNSSSEVSGTENCCQDEAVTMSKEFLVGVAMSVYQNSGGADNNWEAFENMKGWFGQPTIKVPFVFCLSPFSQKEHES